MPDIPEGAKQPSDHAAAKAEATDGPIEITFRNEQYVIDPESANDVELFELIGTIRTSPETDAVFLLPSLVRRTIGSDQYDRFLDANRVNGRVSIETLNEFFEALNGAQGNQSASTSS